MAFDTLPTTAYTTPTGPIIQSAQTEVIALIDAFLAKLPNSSTGAAGSTPDWDAIRPELETNIRTELAAVNAAIEATPTA